MGLATEDFDGNEVAFRRQGATVAIEDNANFARVPHDVGLIIVGISTLQHLGRFFYSLIAVNSFRNFAFSLGR